MRYAIILFVGIFLLSFSSAAVGDSCHADIVSYWNFDDQNVLDQVGSNNGGWVGTAEYDVGKIGKGALLTSSSNINVPDSNSLSSSDFTIELWFKENTNPLVNPSGTLLEKAGEYSISYVSSGQVNAGVGGASVSVGASTTAFNFVALRKQGDSLKLYVGDANGNNLIVNTDTGAGSPAAGSSPLLIGEGFQGIIDEVAFYDSALSDQEINFHFGNSSSGGKDYCTTGGLSQETETNFNIAGCSLPESVSPTGLGIEECLGRTHPNLADPDANAGRYYCHAENELYNTLEDAYACSYFIPGWDFEVHGDACCPNGYKCIEGDSGPELTCEQRLIDCSDITDEETCKEEQCYWVNDQCIEDTSELSCSDYGTDQAKCNLDPWNLGKTGLGTEVCGTYINIAGVDYLIKKESCRCAWLPFEGDATKPCKLTWNLTTVFGDGTDSLTCVKEFDTGLCVDGEKDISWEAFLKDNWGTGDLASVDQAFLDELGCIPGSETRLCGEPVIKLPGYTFIEFFLSLVSIFALYYIRRE